MYDDRFVPAATQVVSIYTRMGLKLENLLTMKGQKVTHVLRISTLSVSHA